MCLPVSSLPLKRSLPQTGQVAVDVVAKIIICPNRSIGRANAGITISFLIIYMQNNAENPNAINNVKYFNLNFVLIFM